MVTLALAFGVTALLVPMTFEHAPKPVLGVPVAAVVLMGALVLGGSLSRVDGALLLVGYAAAIGYLSRLDAGLFSFQRGSTNARTKP